MVPKSSIHLQSVEQRRRRNKRKRKSWRRKGKKRKRRRRKRKRCRKKTRRLKALLHCAIFSETCLAMVENVALQVVEVWCCGPVTLCKFFSNLSRNAPQNEKQEVCSCALVKTQCRKIATQVAGGVIHCAMVFLFAAIRCKKYM